MRKNRMQFCAGFAAAVLMGGMAIALLDPSPSQALEQSGAEQEVSLAR